MQLKHKPVILERVGSIEIRVMQFLQLQTEVQLATRYL